MRDENLNPVENNPPEGFDPSVFDAPETGFPDNPENQPNQAGIPEPPGQYDGQPLESEYGPEEDDGSESIAPDYDQFDPGAPDVDPFAPDADSSEPSDASEQPGVGFTTQFDAYQAEQQAYQDAAGEAFNPEAAYRDQANETFKRMDEKFNESNAKLKKILFTTIGIAAAGILIILAILAISAIKSNLPEKEPEVQTVLQTILPEAAGMKISEEKLQMADPGELSLTLGGNPYMSDETGYLGYTTSIPSLLFLYHGLGKTDNLNQFQANASTYAALIKAELLEHLNIFSNIQYVDYKLQNHPEPEYIGTNYSILSGQDYYDAHNYELLMDSDGCQTVTYSYTFDLSNMTAIETCDFSDYITCLQVLTGYDITNNDVLYLLRVSMNNYQNNGASIVQVVSENNPEDYIMLEQFEGPEPGTYTFVITGCRNLGNIRTPDFSDENRELLDIPQIIPAASPFEVEVFTTQPQ